MIVLTGIVQASGGDGGTTRSGVINPCENPNGSLDSPYCVVQPPGDSATLTDMCAHNGAFYFCRHGDQMSSDWLKGQCDIHGNCRPAGPGDLPADPPPIIP